MKPILKPSIHLSIWLAGSSFVLLQFFLQLSSSVVIGAIMHEMQLSPLYVSILSSSFYIIYTILQIPVGILCDRANPRPILATSALLLSIGCLIFASSTSFGGLYFGRSLMGVGSAFAFVGLTHLIRQHYPVRLFAFMIGLTETLSFVVTVCGIIGMGQMILHWGWRGFINGAAGIGLIVTYLCWRYIPNETKKNTSLKKTKNQLLLVLSTYSLWLNGLFVGLTFAIVTVFGALWSVPFLQVKLSCTLRQASFINALFFLGTGFSCPLFGFLSLHIKRRKCLIISSCFVTMSLLLMILYLPITNTVIMGSLLLLVGLCCGSYILGYPIANELSPPNAVSTSTGFTNTLAVMTAPPLQLLIGFLLQISNTTSVYTIANYQLSLLILPACFLIACILIYFLPEDKII